MHTISLSCSTTDSLRFDSWSILFKFLMLSNAIYTVLLYLSNFCLDFHLSSLADFSNTEPRAPTSAECLFDTIWMVGIRIMVIFQ